MYTYTGREVLVVLELEDLIPLKILIWKGFRCST